MFERVKFMCVMYAFKLGCYIEYGSYTGVTKENNAFRDFDNTVVIIKVPNRLTVLGFYVSPQRSVGEATLQILRINVTIAISCIFIQKWQKRCQPKTGFRSEYWGEGKLPKSFIILY